VAVVQYTFTHKQYTEYTERNIHNNKQKKKGKCRPFPVFASYTLEFALQLRKKHGKPSVRVVETCPDIPVAVVQYTFTHKQCTEQHNENTQNGTYTTIRILKLTKGHITTLRMFLPPVHAHPPHQHLTNSFRFRVHNILFHTQHLYFTVP
jgi:hypothetical protein